MCMLLPGWHVYLWLSYVPLLNAFELAFFVWVLAQFGVKLCYHEHTVIIVMRVFLAVTTQGLCSFITLSLYALVTQMCSQFKGKILEDNMADILKQWHGDVRRKRKKEEQESQSALTSFSLEWSSMRHIICICRFLTSGEGVTLEIHHGGDFMNVGNEQFDYVAGEICWVECLDPDKTSWVELNAFAWRLGYREPPVIYWFKHPTEHVFWPISNDIDAINMLKLLPESRKIVVYYVGGGTRQIKLCEMEDLIENFEEIIPHIKFKPKVKGRPLYVVGYVKLGSSQSWEDVHLSGLELVEVVDRDGESAAEDESVEVVDRDGESVAEDEFIDSDYEIRPEDDPEFGEVSSVIDGLVQFGGKL